MRIAQYAALLILTGAAGFASSLLWPVPNGLMAAALGASLSAGTIWLGARQARQGGRLATSEALAGGLGAGLLGGALMAAISVACADFRRHEFGPPTLPFWAPLVLGVAYGVVIHWSYHRRRLTPGALWPTLVRTCTVCVALKAAATLLFLVLHDHRNPGDMVMGSVLFALFGALPFAFLWVLGTRWLDPHWSHPAWQPAPPDGPP